MCNNTHADVKAKPSYRMGTELQDDNESDDDDDGNDNGNDIDNK